jgi:hypothetical protein
MHRRCAVVMTAEGQATDGVRSNSSARSTGKYPLLLHRVPLKERAEMSYYMHNKPVK